MYREPERVMGDPSFGLWGNETVLVVPSVLVRVCKCFVKLYNGMRTRPM